MSWAHLQNLEKASIIQNMNNELEQQKTFSYSYSMNTTAVLLIITPNLISLRNLTRDEEPAWNRQAHYIIYTPPACYSLLLVAKHRLPEK